VHSHLVIINRRGDYGKLQIRYRENIRISHLLILLYSSATLKLLGDALVAERQTERTRPSMLVAQENLMATDLQGRLIGKAEEPFATVLVKRVSFRDWL
jgi:hypothetical protein